MNDEFDSALMAIEIRGNTVAYQYRGKTPVYEIREVRLNDLAKLRLTNRSDLFSSSATVQYLTHVYAGSHYLPSGQKPKPPRSTMAELLPKTPYR